MNTELLKEEVQAYLQQQAEASPARIALAKSPFTALSSAALAAQIESRQKARLKLPEWYRTSGIYYPVALSIEQASSATTAAYKASLVEEGEKLIDLTGGFGVDSFFFARKSSRVLHCELNAELSDIARHNARQLGQHNIDFICADGVGHLLSLPAGSFTTAFIDPSRRVKTQKVFRLEDCEPNILAVQDELLDRCQRVLVKTSPLLDLSLTLAQLKHVCEVHIVSIKNECKELIFVMEAGFEGSPTLSAVLLNEEEKKLSFQREEESGAALRLGEPGAYLYDPDVALLKAGVFKWISSRFDLFKLHQNTHLYTSAVLDRSFPGRVFRVMKVLAYKDFKKEKGGHAANVIAKNFPLSVSELRKKHKIAESKDTFLFFCRTSDEQLRVIAAERL